MHMCKKYICPIVIDCIEKDTFEILPNVYLSKMSAEDKEDYFNVIDDIYGIGNVFVTTNDPIQPNINDYGFRLGCDHKIIMPAAIFEQVVATLILFKTSNFGIKYIRGDQYKDFDIIPNCLFIPKLILSKEDIPSIRKLYPNIALCIDDKIFTKIIQSYKRILSFSELTPDEKYRDLVVILENLYIQGETHNIKKKLSSRVAEYFHVFYAQDYNEIYNFTKNAYSIRSSIAHSGESYFDFENKDNNEFLRLLNITRLSILLYVEHMYAFNPDKLKLINFTDNTSSPSHS